MTEIEKGITKYGRSVYITDDAWTSAVFKAFVRPLRYKNKMYMSGDYTALGHFDEGYYLYIGPPDIDIENLSEHARLHTDDMKKYQVHKAETVYSSETPIYIWAIIREKA